MQLIEYATPFAVYNPGLTGLGWSQYGASPAHGDYSNLTGVMSGDLSGKATYEHILTADDGAIPARASIYSVEISYTLGQSDITLAQGGLTVAPYLRYENSPPVYYAPQRPSYVNGFAPFLAEFLTDPNGLPWSRDSIFRLKGRRLLFGLRTLIPDPWLVTAQLLWSECRFRVKFLAPVPVVVTISGVSVAHNQALLTGTIDPRSATTRVPARWWFEYGPAEGVYDHISAKTYVTGDGVSTVTLNLLTLTGGTQYHFRIGGDTPDGAVYGEDKTFATLVFP